MKLTVGYELLQVGELPCMDRPARPRQIFQWKPSTPPTAWKRLGHWNPAKARAYGRWTEIEQRAPDPKRDLTSAEILRGDSPRRHFCVEMYDRNAAVFEGYLRAAAAKLPKAARSPDGKLIVFLHPGSFAIPNEEPEYLYFGLLYEPRCNFDQAPPPGLERVCPRAI